MIHGRRFDEIIIQIKLQPEIEARLAAEAQARGVALEVHIARKLAQSTPVQRPARRRAAVAQAVDGIRQLRKGNRLGVLKVKDLIHEI